MFYFIISAKINATFLIKWSRKKFDHAPIIHDITFLMVQCVGKMTQLSNQLSQRDGTGIKFGWLAASLKC